ncbi:MAG: helix-turn-helix transcriptional regulator [Afipia sp.]|nr:helix-turn-helix transcriptional regulator [Afipia sp.]
MPKSVFTDAYASVVEYLIALRKEKGVSQVELARRLGRPQPFVSFVENKERRLDLVEFCVYVRALGGDPEKAVVEVVRALPKDIRI